MGRTVFEVTKMSEKVKARLMQRPSELDSETSVPEVKVKDLLILSGSQNWEYCV